MARRRFAALLIATAGVTYGAAAHESSEPFAAWYQSLKQPESGVSCCSIADCGPIESRVGPAAYEVYVDEAWVPVPAERVLRRTTNPTGRAQLCRSPVDKTILCFVPASET
jgi:hypothetical protein